MKVYTGQVIQEANAFRDFKEMVAHSEMTYGDNDAYMFRRAPRTEVLKRSFCDFARDVRAMAEFFITLTERNPRAHIAFIDKNSYEWMVTHLAAMCSHRVSVPLDNQLPDGEVINLIDRGDVEIFITNLRHYEAAKKAFLENPSLHTLIFNDLTLEPKDNFPDFPEAPVGKRILLLSEALAEGQALRDQGSQGYEAVEIDPREMTAIFFTSGTTAQAKGVMLSQENILENIYSIASTVAVYPGERFLSILPIHHTFEHTTAQIYPLGYGCTVCYADGLRHLAENLQEWKISAMAGVPTLFESMWRILLKGIDESGKKYIVKFARPIARSLEKSGIKIRRKVFSQILEKLGGNLRLFVVGAAPSDIEVIKGFNDIGIDFYQGYGLTEHSPVASACNPKINVEGSVGPPLYNVEIAISEDDSLEAGQGEVLVRSKSTMLGYYKNEEATREVIDEEGWLHTGDMGYFDHTGSLHITGRYKSVIVLSSGKKAFPEEIENLFHNTPGILATLVWGEENNRDQVDIGVRFEIDEAAMPIAEKTSEDEIRLYLAKVLKNVNQQLPSYKQIKYFVYSSEKIIRNTTLKIKRNDEIDRMHLAFLEKEKKLRELDGSRIY